MNPLEHATRRAIDQFASKAERDHLGSLRAKKLTSTRCDRCARIGWPPRDFCPYCGNDRVTQVEIGSGATLFAFTQQHRSLRFAAPEVIGIVDIPEVGRIVSAIDAPYDALSIGMPLELDFVEIQEGVTVHRFRPVQPNR